MLLTDIAEAMVTQLNSSPGRWTTLTGVEAKATLDWVTCLSRTSLQVLVVPEMVQYAIGSSLETRRSSGPKLLAIEGVKFVSLMVGKAFTDLPTNNDVTVWNESKSLLDIRERATQFLIANPPTVGGKALRLVDIEEIPVDELELDNRNFVAITQFGYEAGQCGSGPDLLSL